MILQGDGTAGSDYINANRINPEVFIWVAKMIQVKGSCAKVVIKVAPGIGYSAATGSGAQVVVLAVGAEEQSQNSGKLAGLALLECRSL